MARTFGALPPAESAPPGTLFAVELDPQGIPSTASLTVDKLFESVEVPAHFRTSVIIDTLEVDASILVDKLTIGNTFTPNTSSDVVPARQIWFDANYLYVTTAEDVIKRVPLQSFT